MVGLFLLAYLLIYAFFNLDEFQSARGILNVFISIKPYYPYFFSTQIYYRPAWNSSDFGTMVSGLIFQFGFLGAILVLFNNDKKDNNKEKFGWILLSIWFLVYFIGAVNSWSGEPTRMGRDLALPASILAAVSIYKIYVLLKQKGLNTINYTFTAVIIVLCLNGLTHKITMQTSYTSMVRFSKVDQEAYQYLIDSGLSTSTKVIAKEPSWQTVARIRNTADQFAAISAGDQEYNQAESYQCYLIGWYNGIVWPNDYANREKALSYINNPKFKVIKTFSDPKKDLSLLCQNPL